MAENEQIGKYNIDICLCIDKTGSMTPIMDTVKENALNLYHDIKDSLEKSTSPDLQTRRKVDRLRIRIICFGDYKADKEPMLLTPFIDLPDDAEKFEQFVKSINPDGGGDEPEDGLEALAYAIRSDWCSDGWRRRHIIALFTDASAHQLGFGKSEPTYPKEHMPKNFGELSEMWGDSEDPGEMDHHSKRLLLFAPDVSFWHTIANCWDNTIMRTTQEASGLRDISYQSMLDSIVHSV